MKRKWSITQLMAVAGLAVLDVVVGLAASIITATTGITMASGFITSISEPLLLMVCLLLIRRFGAGILFMAIVSVLTLPFNYAGPPGFFAKVPIILALGVICDLLFLGLRKVNTYFTGFVIGAVLCLWYTFAVAFVGRLLQIPGIDNFLNVMPLSTLIASVSIVGGIGGLLGVWIYSRISNTSVVARIKGGSA